VTTKNIINVSDLSETDQVGRMLAELLPDNSVVSLVGTLGAGKTRLVQYVAKYSGIDVEIVTSPTFVLIHEYEGDRPIYHFDTYRLANETEFKQLDPDDYFERGGITFIEWGNKFPQSLPQNHLEIKIEITGEYSRKFILTSNDKKFDKIMAAKLNFF
jgi:tRNA threonylcarbamoyladenosine biosynthesis protein TsaE